MAVNRPVASMVAVSSALGLAALPVFLVGGLAVQIRQELGFTPTQLGAAVTGCFVAGALSAPFGGRLADRLGARASILSGATLSSLALAGIGGFARSWAVLAACLALAGMSFAFADPGLAILITKTIPRERHGLAFGVKEASIPLATLAAGLAVPAIALTLGWRWAFGLGLLPLAGLAVILPRLDLSGGAQTIEGTLPGPPPRRAVVTVAVAAALGSTAAAGIGVFLTESGVAMGLTPAGAGYLLAAGSIMGVVARVSTGALADRRSRPQIGVIAIMLMIGAAAMALSSTGNVVLLVVGTLGAFAAGWGWSGLFFLSLVRASPGAPGAVTGIGLMGLSMGNAVGPLAFGSAAERFSFATAWILAAAVATLAAALMWSVRDRFEPEGSSPGSPRRRSGVSFPERHE